MKREFDGAALMKRIREQRPVLTPRGRILADFILQNPRKVVFMRTRQLASVCQTSESTVVRFVSQLGCSRYSDFLQAMRDYVDTELTLLDRVELSSAVEPGKERLQRVVFEEIDNLKQLYENLDMETAAKVADAISASPGIFVVGSRHSYTLAYYMGWSLSKVRGNIEILRGSDTTTIDWLTIAPPDSLVVIVATSRYPNELIRLARVVRRLGQKLVVIADSAICPLLQFAHLSLVAPSRFIPVFGSPSTLSCLINYLTFEVAGRNGGKVRLHQEKIEQSYRENDILFNLEKAGENDSPL